MDKTFAIVGIYEGVEPSSTEIEVIQNVLARLAKRGDSRIILRVLDTEDIVRNTVESVVLHKDNIVADLKEEDHVTAAKKAMFIINGRYADMFVKDKNLVAFVAALATAVTSARINNNDDELLHAIDTILIDDLACIDVRTRNRYGFSKDVISAIRQAYIPTYQI